MTRTGALRWFKSSYSDGGGGNCLEVAYEHRPTRVAAIHIRDSKNPTGPALALTPDAWRRFAESV
ncbi:DUF397 domain-containing protein [Streptomyces sp. NPDC057950]|uniref:DUF397 domain-containing protein n=1 Tax=Streptomyces sp. NPDC057950 TaxID=3346288 RepID=UPI0036E6D50E